MILRCKVVVVLPLLLLLALSRPTASLSSLSSPSPLRKTASTTDDAARALRRIFEDLERPGRLHRAALTIPTLRFSHVRPSPDHVSGTGTGTVKGKEEQEERRHPSDDDPSDPTKPIALYIPGLDGLGLSASRSQFDDLASVFELWRLTVLRENRSSFTEVVGAIVDFLENGIPGDRDRRRREVVLIADGACGGILAMTVVLHMQRKRRVSCRRSSNPSLRPRLRGLVLAGPWASFDEGTPWDVVTALVASLPQTRITSGTANISPLSVLGGPYYRQILAEAFLDNVITPAVGGQGAIRDAASGFANLIRTVGEYLPPEAIRHRLGWLAVGSTVIRPRLGRMDIPTLVVTSGEGGGDVAADRAILDAIPKSETLLVKGRRQGRSGRSVLDENVNLTEAILYSKIDPLDWKEKKDPYDPILDWSLPSPEFISKVVEEDVEPLRVAHSPVFFSTDVSGRRWLGVSKIPRPKGPLLFVGNHQFLAADLRLLASTLIEQRGIVARGLAHPVIFQTNVVSELRGRTPGLKTTPESNPLTAHFQDFGAVPVSPRNYYRLLESGQDVMLFPGGAPESLNGSREYPLMWPSGSDFVRTAARFNATIVPLSAIGMADSVNVVLEAEDFSALPWIGAIARNYSDGAPAARYDQKKATAGKESMVPPLAVPGPPARNYFLFGEPIATDALDHRDRDACDRLYRRCRAEVRRGLDDLIRARERDPFALDAAARWAYERWTGTAAPTFSAEELHGEGGRRGPRRRHP